MSFRCLKKEDFVQPDCLHGAGLSLGVFFWYFKEHSILISEVSPCMLQLQSQERTVLVVMVAQMSLRTACCCFIIIQFFLPCVPLKH